MSNLCGFRSVFVFPRVGILVLNVTNRRIWRILIRNLVSTPRIRDRKRRENGIVTATFCARYFSSPPNTA